MSGDPAYRPVAATLSPSPDGLCVPQPSSEMPSPSKKRSLDSLRLGLGLAADSGSIHSKRSAEKLYSKPDEHQFLRYFVKAGSQRRSAAINRGYWLRMQAIEYLVFSFLREELPAPKKKKVVVNLGCGHDTLPFRCLSKDSMDSDILYVDIDHPDIMSVKASIVSQTREINSFLVDGQHFPTPVDHVHYRSKNYIALSCDLRDLKTLQRLFEQHGLIDVSILFTAEMSLIYLACATVDALINWIVHLPDARFSLLEPFLPSGATNPFAHTMLNHYESVSTPLESAVRYPQLIDQIERFSSRGWKSVDACDLQAFWTNRVRLSERERIEKIETFDEWEEHYCFAQHHFILFAHNGPSLHSPFYGPNISWSGCGEYRRFPSRPTILTTSSSGDNSLGFATEFTSSSVLKRRFGAAAAIASDSLVYQGGQGVTARLGTSLVITHADKGTGLPKGAGPGARICHTMTTLSNGKVLLVGGRRSPDKLLGDTWLLEDGEWRKVDDLPSPRYRHAATATADGERVLVYGGRGERGVVLGDFFLWSEDKGWRALPCVGDSLPQARFSTGICWTDRGFGAMGGGLNANGDVFSDMWRLELLEDPKTGAESIRPYWSMVNVLSNRCLWKRFGGHMLYTGYGRILYIGGVSGNGSMKTENQILEVDCNKVTVRAICTGFPQENAPLLVGHSAVCLQDRVIICGGGGVCFNFGTVINSGIWTLSDGEKHDFWKFIEEGKGLEDISHHTDDSMSDAPAEAYLDGHRSPPAIFDLARVRITSAEEFNHIVDEAEPVLLQDLSFGCCINTWTPEYLKKTVARDRLVVVHASKSSALSFQAKDFTSMIIPFEECIDTVFTTDTRVYLRSPYNDKSNHTATTLHRDYPTLAPDFVLPSTLAMVSETLLISSLRIASVDAGTQLHYDNLPIIICLVTGRKLFRLYPPGDVNRLSFPHGESTSNLLDVFSRASPYGTSPCDVEMGPGDVLFIPPLWVYAAKALTPSVGVGVFFGSSGSREVVAYDMARKKVRGIVDSFKDLPRDVSRFYLERLAGELKDAAGE